MIGHSELELWPLKMLRLKMLHCLPVESTLYYKAVCSSSHTHFTQAQVVVAVQEGTSGSPLAESVRKTVEMFVARLREVNSVGGNVATDPVILSHYQNLTALQPQLLKQIDDVQLKKSKLYNNKLILQWQGIL